MPATARLSLIAIGTPANGRVSPGATASAAASAPSAVDVHERVELRVERLDALERRAHQLARADLPGAHELGELQRGCEEQVGHPLKTTHPGIAGTRHLRAFSGHPSSLETHE